MNNYFVNVCVIYYFRLNFFFFWDWFSNCCVVHFIHIQSVFLHQFIQSQTRQQQKNKIDMTIWQNSKRKMMLWQFLLRWKAFLIMYLKKIYRCREPGRSSSVKWMVRWYCLREELRWLEAGQISWEFFTHCLSLFLYLFCLCANSLSFLQLLM